MAEIEIPDGLVVPAETKIVFLIIDGLGGLPMEEFGGSEMQVAHLPNLDALAASSSCGLLEPVGPGITPGSGPGHLALFGYDPYKYEIGRGVMSALGLDFPLQPGDVAARLNFATLDGQGRVLDRRAGRLDDQTNERLCQKIGQSVKLEVEFHIQRESGYRGLLVLRGEGLSDEVRDTDPQRTGVPPHPAQATGSAGERTACIVESFLNQAGKVLADEERGNMVLLRGFAQYQRYPSMQERFGLQCLAVAGYPMYRGLARLVGMDSTPLIGKVEEAFAAVEQNFPKYDFFFLHVKEPDSRGEDADFLGKVRALERVDALVPRLTALKPDVLVVTGDHSTPAKLASHSWHPVPALLHSRYSRADGLRRFDEASCLAGSLGLRPMLHLMPLALASAGRLTKYGA